MNKPILGPEILDERMEYMSTKSMWYFVDTINHALKTNSVSSDGHITVVIRYNIDSEIINKLVDLYITNGWEDINVTLTGSAGSLYGTTEFEFIPPEDELFKVKRKIIKLM
jgi:hypothetical protein